MAQHHLDTSQIYVVLQQRFSKTGSVSVYLSNVIDFGHGLSKDDLDSSGTVLSSTGLNFRTV